jgi:hypothetical protein
MKCPGCKLINPDTARRCDCGYDFETKTVERRFLSEKQKQDGGKGEHYREPLLASYCYLSESFLWL